MSPGFVVGRSIEKVPSTVEEAVEMNPASVERPPTASVEDALRASPTSSVLLIVEEALEINPSSKCHAFAVVDACK